jgi:hypothetical protein
VSAFDKVLIALGATGMIVLFLIVLTPRAPAEAAALDSARAALPSGATLIYENDYNSHQKRVIQIKGCYFTEVWDGEHWVLMSDDGYVAVQCLR